MPFAICSSNRFQVCRRKPIEQPALLRLAEGLEGIALRVDECQLGGQLLQHPNSRELIIDENSPLTACGDLAPQQNLFPIEVDAGLIEQSLRARRGLKDTAHDRLLCAMADHVAGRLPAQ